MDQAHTLLEYLRGVRAKDVISDNDHGPFLKLMRDVLLFTMVNELLLLLLPFSSRAPHWSFGSAGLASKHRLSALCGLGSHN